MNDRTMALTESILLSRLPNALADRSQLILDMDDHTLPAGIYRVSPSTQNLPDGVYQYGLAEIAVCSWSGNRYIRQTYVSDSGELLYRLYWGDSIGWRVWYVIATSKIVTST